MIAVVLCSAACGTLLLQPFGEQKKISTSSYVTVSDDKKLLCIDCCYDISSPPNMPCITTLSRNGNVLDVSDGVAYRYDDGTLSKHDLARLVPTRFANFEANSAALDSKTKLTYFSSEPVFDTNTWELTSQRTPSCDIMAVDSVNGYLFCARNNMLCMYSTSALKTLLAEVALGDSQLQNMHADGAKQLVFTDSFMVSYAAKPWLLTRLPSTCVTPSTAPNSNLLGCTGYALDVTTMMYATWAGVNFVLSADVVLNVHGSDVQFCRFPNWPYPVKKEPLLPVVSGGPLQTEMKTVTYGKVNATTACLSTPTVMHCMTLTDNPNAPISSSYDRGEDWFFTGGRVSFHNGFAYLQVTGLEYQYLQVPVFPPVGETKFVNLTSDVTQCVAWPNKAFCSDGTVIDGVNWQIMEERVNVPMDVQAMEADSVNLLLFYGIGTTVLVYGTSTGMPLIYTITVPGEVNAMALGTARKIFVATYVGTVVIDYTTNTPKVSIFIGKLGAQQVEYSDNTLSVQYDSFSEVYDVSDMASPTLLGVVDKGVDNKQYPFPPITVTAKGQKYFYAGDTYTVPQPQGPAPAVLMKTSK